MLSPDSMELSRSRGWYSDEELAVITDESRLSIAGVGGAGFAYGLGMVRSGVQSIAVADPDVFERQNMNRVPGATESNLGRNKAVVFAEMAREINPDVDVDVYKEGVTRKNAADFVGGSSLVFDGIDVDALLPTIALHQAARRAGTAVLTGLEVGPSAMVTSYKPKGGVTLEQVTGFKPDEDLDSIQEKIDLSKNKGGNRAGLILPYLPYKSGHLAVLKAVLEGAPLPSSAEGVELFSALAQRQSMLHLLGGVSNHRPEPVWADKYRVYDLDAGARTVKRSTINLLGYVARLKMRELFDRNPDSGYSADYSDK